MIILFSTVQLVNIYPWRFLLCFLQRVDDLVHTGTEFNSLAYPACVHPSECTRKASNTLIPKRSLALPFIRCKPHPGSYIQGVRSRPFPSLPPPPPQTGHCGLLPSLLLPTHTQCRQQEIALEPFKRRLDFSPDCRPLHLVPPLNSKFRLWTCNRRRYIKAGDAVAGVD